MRITGKFWGEFSVTGRIGLDEENIFRCTDLDDNERKLDKILRVSPINTY